MLIFPFYFNELLGTSGKYTKYTVSESTGKGMMIEQCGTRVQVHYITLSRLHDLILHRQTLPSSVTQARCLPSQENEVCLMIPLGFPPPFVPTVILMTSLGAMPPP